MAAYQVGQTKIIVLPPDSPALPGPAKTGVHHLAIESADPLAAAGASGLSSAALQTVASFDGGSRVFVTSDASQGVAICYATPLQNGGAQTGMTAGITERIDHLGIVSRSVSAARDLFCGRLGFALESYQTDVEAELPLETFTSSKYGVVYHSRPPRPKAGVLSVFATIGDFELEFLEAFDPSGAGHGNRPEGPGHTRQDSNAIARFLASRGPSLAHVALKVQDINAVLASFDKAGRPLLDTVGRPGGRRSLIGFMHPDAMGGVLFHFVQRTEI